MSNIQSVHNGTRKHIYEKENELDTLKKKNNTGRSKHLNHDNSYIKASAKK